MATALHSAVEYSFDTNTTDLATGTTLGAATRFDFTGITVYIPETLVGATPFRSVHVEITVRGQYATSARNIAGWLIGIKLDAVAFDDVSYTPSSISNSGETYTLKFTRDVTDYFNTNWSGTSMTCQVGVAFATNTADNVGNITAKLVIGGYDYDDTSTTYIQTVRIPIQSLSGLLSTTKTEIGTAGANPAPANQIPELDSFLPEASKTIRQAWIEIMANDGGAAIADFRLIVEIDSAGETNRTLLESGLSTTAYFQDHYIYDTATYLTSSAHSFNVRSSLANRFPLIGAVLHVTYEYAPGSSTRFLQSLKIPLDSVNMQPAINGTTSADADRYVLELWVPEPGTITMLQSGLVLRIGADGSAGPDVLSMAGGTERTYTPGLSSCNGNLIIVNRADISSDWTLARGKNRLYWDIYNTTSADNSGLAGGFAIINYTSDEAPGGKATHNRTTIWDTCDYRSSGTNTGVREIAAASQRTPGGLGASYFVNTYGQDRLLLWGSANTSAQATGLTAYEIGASEFEGGGWASWSRWNNDTEELGQHDYTVDLLSSFNRTDQATGKMDIETSRRFQLEAGGGTASYGGVQNYLTHHEVTFDVSGTVSGYGAGDGSGLTVQVWDATEGVLAAEATTAIGGTYTAVVYDDTDTYFATCREDSTHVGRSDNVVPA